MRGEKTGLSSELKNVSILVCWLLLISTALPQIPINGFCQLNSFPVIPGYKKFVIADINYDSFNDYILYTPIKNSIQVIERVKDTTFSSYQIFSANYISAMTPAYESKTGSMQFFFLDREKRTAGIFYLTSKNRLDIIDKYMFDSYPENIDAGDIDRDGSTDYLISGAGFKGLSIIRLKGNKLVENNIAAESSYNEAIFADISNDGFQDIVAYNLFKNTLDIFFNDEFGNFEYIRSIPLKESIENLRVVHNDDYDDIIFSSSGSINIIAGDFESSYDNIRRIKAENQPDKFIISDLNNDKLKDIAYIDITRGTLSIMFAKNENQYYPEIIYLQKDGITDLKSIRKNYNNGLVVLDSNGEMFRITRLSSMPEEAKIVPSVYPSTVISFDFGNDGVDDLGYLDQSDNEINFLVSNYMGIPTYFYSIPVSAEYDKIIVDDTEPFNKGFYCYTPGKKLLEIVDYNFTKDEPDNNQLYAPGTIKDLVINKTDNLAHIYIAFEQNKALEIGEYEHHGFRFNYREYSFYDNNIIQAKLFITDLPELYYWKNYNDTLYLIKARTNSKSTFNQVIGSVKNEMYNSLTNVNEYFISDRNPEVLTIFETDSSLYVSLFSDSIFTFTNLDIDSSLSSGGTSGVNNPRFSSAIRNDDLVVYLAKAESFNKIDPKIRGGKLFARKLFDNKDVKDYVIQKKNKNNAYIIYTHQTKGFLSLKRLK